MDKLETKNHSFWKRYYYSYLNSFLGFLVPDNARSFLITAENTADGKKVVIPSKGFEYIIVSDTLGRTEDIEDFLVKSREALTSDGRLVITQYNALWEPVLSLATYLGLRKGALEQNWLSMNDLKNFLTLSGYEYLKFGTKMILPIYIPIVSFLLNKIVANIWPFTRLGIFHYIIARKKDEGKNLNSSISIIVPARNEKGTIEKIVEELPNLGAFTEIIFIEGNSKDNTFDEIKKVADKYKTTKKIKYAKQTGTGKGDAVRLGFSMAEGDILAIYDADMTVPPNDIPKFYRAIVENCGEFINGSRLVYQMEKQSMRVLNFLGNKFFSFAFSSILGQPLKDTLCGTKVLWRKDYEKIKNNRKFFGDFDPFGDFDLLFGASKLNLKIIDLPIRYRERSYGTTNISRWKHGWLLLKMTAFALKKMKFI